MKKTARFLTIRGSLPATFLIAAFLLAGCSGLPGIESRNMAAGSCDARENLGFCYDYDGSFWTEEFAKNECAPVGAYAATKCPAEKLAANCRYNNTPDGSQLIVYHYYQPLDEVRARDNCPGTEFELVE